jgi:hypothetical protein
MNQRPCPGECYCGVLLQRLETFEAERIRETDEVTQWDRTFGAPPPCDRKSRTRQHEQINAALAFRAQMDVPP